LRRVDYEHYWIEVSHPIAYRKVGHAFRSKARTNMSESSTNSTSQNPLARSPSVSREGGLMVGVNQVPSVLPGRALLGRTNFLGERDGVSLAGMTARQHQQSLFNSALVNPIAPYPIAMHLQPAMFALRPELSLSARLALPPPLTEQTPLLSHQHLLGAPRGFIGGIAGAPSDIALENALALSRMIGSLSSHRGQANEALLHAGRRGTYPKHPPQPPHGL
jgi:hypothetical protein